MSQGQRVGYIRVSSEGQNTARQLDGVPLDMTFTDKVSGKDTNRPELSAMLNYVRQGDEIFVHSMDRLARNLDDLRRLVMDLNKRGIKVTFVKEAMTFVGDDSPMSLLMLSLLGAVSEFERAQIRARQAEGVYQAKLAGKYKGRKPSLDAAKATQLRERVKAGEKKATLAREFGISRETLYAYLRAAS
jgi:DNA invertase Pin-like site-specific DNA recombinase